MLARQGGGSAEPGDPGRPGFAFWRRRQRAEAEAREARAAAAEAEARLAEAREAKAAAEQEAVTAREAAEARAAQAEQSAREQVAAARQERDEAVAGAQSRAASWPGQSWTGCAGPRGAGGTGPPDAEREAAGLRAGLEADRGGQTSPGRLQARAEQAEARAGRGAGGACCGGGG